MQIYLLFLVGVLSFSNMGMESVAPLKRPVIKWNSKRDLVWDDFQAKTDLTSEFSALSSTGISFSFTASIFREQIFIEFDIYAYFAPSESWANPDKRMPELLIHEQLHFDIAEIYVRKIRNRLDDVSFSKDDYKEVIEEIFNQLWEELNETHTRYDEETEHGENLFAQQRWRLMVVRELMQSD